MPELDDLSIRLSEYEVKVVLGLDAVPPEIAHYELRAELGRGGYGLVCQAWDKRLQRTVALKLTLATSEDAIDERDINEARALARVNHRNVVAVHEVGKHGGRVYIAMELVDGVRLDEWVGDRPSERRVLDVLCQVGDGLAAVHAAGLAHRDVKPSNIVVDSAGRAVLVDLGLARVEGAVGTLPYMAPEVVAGRVADQRSDQYSFALVVRDALESTGSLHLGNKMSARALMEDPRERWPSIADAVEALRPQPRRPAGGMVLGVGGLLGLLLVAAAMMHRPSREPIGLGIADVRIALDARAAARTGETQRAFKLWSLARLGLQANYPALAGLLFTQLADEVESGATTRSDTELAVWGVPDVRVAAIFMIGASEAFEDAGMLEHARGSRRRAARLLRSVDDDTTADELENRPVPGDRSQLGPAGRLKASQ